LLCFGIRVECQRPRQHDHRNVEETGYGRHLSNFAHSFIIQKNILDAEALRMSQDSILDSSSMLLSAI